MTCTSAIRGGRVSSTSLLRNKNPRLLGCGAWFGGVLEFNVHRPIFATLDIVLIYFGILCCESLAWLLSVKIFKYKKSDNSEDLYSKSRIDESTYQNNYEAYKAEVEEERRLKPKSPRWKYFFISQNGTKMTNNAIVLVCLCLFSVLSSIFAIWIDFAPAESTQLFGQCAGGVAAVSWILWQSWISAGNEDEHFSKLPNYKLVKTTTAKQLVVFLGCPFMAYFYIWSVFSVSLPYLYTQSFGNSYQLITEVEKKEGYSRRSCSYQIYFEEMIPAYPDYICIDRQAFFSGSTSFKFTGKESKLGINFSRVETLP